MSADDHRLISECLGGRIDAFGELVCKHQNRLYNTVLRLVGDAEDARDVLQDTFLSAYQSLHTFKGGSQFFTWLYRIAINTAITLKRKRRAIISLTPGGDGQPAHELADDSDSNRPGHNLEMAEQERKVQDALARLSPEHRVVLILKDLDAKKYEEMAEILDVPIGTVRSRLHRARLELRDILLKGEATNT